MRLRSDHGEVCLVEVDGDAALLHAGERAHAAALSPHRAREWIAGRTALRQVLGDVGPILSDDRGAPIAPAGFVASVTHKHTRAAALVAADTGARIGIDLELAAPPRQDIGSRILTPRERPRSAREVTLFFAIKEAIYKAVDPFVRRYVGFQEVELEIGEDGSAVVASALDLMIEAAWRELDGHWLATARARSR